MVKPSRQFKLSNKDLKEHQERLSKKDCPSYSLSIVWPLILRQQLHHVSCSWNRNSDHHWTCSFPTVQGRVEDRQAKQKAHHDGERPLREFALNDRVYVQNFPTKKPRWIAGTIVKVTGPLSYEVEFVNGLRVRQHVDNVRRREGNYFQPRVTSSVAWTWVSE